MPVRNISFRNWKLALHIALLTSGAMIWTGCNKANVAASSDNGKIPITTESEEARNEFLAGRDLSDKLLAHESLAHFDQAISMDPTFATAEFYRATNSPTTKEFQEHLQNALNLSDKVSDGERLLILAAQAANNGDAVKQKEFLEKAVAEYPNDERAQLTLGTYYFAIQDLDKAVEHLKKATEIAPDFSATYNQLGYTYRQREEYANAEQAFQKYILLIPNDPNPYDSYAELLLKEGKFDESLVEYHKALSMDPHFAPSHFGISADYLYLNRPDEANAELQTMADRARSDGELRTAYFGMAVVASDRGKFDDALKAMAKEYAVAQKKNDVVSMAADLQAEGNIQLAKQDYAGAAKSFDTSFQMIASSNQSQEIKDNSALLHHFNEAAVAIGKKDLAVARMHAEEFGKGAQASNNPAQVQQEHEILGRIALAAKDYSAAVSELQKANLQNPYNLYRLGQAYQGQGDKAKSQEYFTKAKNFNPLPGLNYAFIRRKLNAAAQGA
ncbi:MAG: tetratricopeptide repeat protein [Terriglobales bacterium]